MGSIGFVVVLIDPIDQLTLFRCCRCNQHVLTKLPSSIAPADAPAVAADQPTVVIVVAVTVADTEL